MRLLLSNLEYVLLRLVRRFLAPDALLRRFGRWFPYYRAHLSQDAPDAIVDRYVKYLARRRVDIAGATILELGAGATNSCGYELAARRARHIFCVEPFVPFEADLDRKTLALTAARHGQGMESLAAATERLLDIRRIPDRAVTVILSHSVLEHVQQPRQLFTEMRRVLTDGGAMLHLVDYRDHFFKYPLHFLQFSSATWNRFLNPGDLPRWRLTDHVEQAQDVGLKIEVLEQDKDAAAFDCIHSHMAPEFSAYGEGAGILGAVLYARKPIVS
ncbi:MAG: class I SAM-dependent methyltransferase [Methylococcaceae bacterium]|nr:class I SAM-dependent methyltransferase [Methylococcaceae bacterium]